MGSQHALEYSTCMCRKSHFFLWNTSVLKDGSSCPLLCGIARSAKSWHHVIHIMSTTDLYQDLLFGDQRSAIAWCPIFCVNYRSVRWSARHCSHWFFYNPSLVRSGAQSMMVLMVEDTGMRQSYCTATPLEPSSENNSKLWITEPSQANSPHQYVCNINKPQAWHFTFHYDAAASLHSEDHMMHYFG